MMMQERRLGKTHPLVVNKIKQIFLSTIKMMMQRRRLVGQQTKIPTIKEDDDAGKMIGGIYK